MAVLKFKIWGILFLITCFVVVGCTSKAKKRPIEKKGETVLAEPVQGFEVIAKLNELRFFSLTSKEMLDSLKTQMIDNYDKRKFFDGITFNDSLRYVDYRFYFVDCEELFEQGGLIYYMNEVKPTFDKLGIPLDFHIKVNQIKAIIGGVPSSK